jgi:GNAT superfamily N-acetyltransferase
LACREYTPWLAGLYVDESYRGEKIGVQLIERVKDIAKELGYDELYLRTEHASNYYRRLKWQFVESCYDDYDLKPDVFKVALI